MVNRKFIAGLILAFALAVQAGCSPASTGDNAGTGGTGKEKTGSVQEATGKQEATGESTASPNENQDKIMGDFKALVESKAQVAEIIGFIDASIGRVSKENASAMVVGLEDAQKAALPGLDEKFSKNAEIGKEMEKIYKPGFDINKLEDVQNKELKELLTETRDGGFKVETAEGMYFPVIDYEFYKKYSAYTAPDISDYINIMAVESNKVPAKDAALMIGWDEILARAMDQEKFIQTHGSSVKTDEVKQLYKKYVSFTLYGLNNTPLFDYGTKTMAPKAKEAYLKAVEGERDSTFLKMLKDYMEVLKKNGYKLTDEVEKFRKAQG